MKKNENSADDEDPSLNDPNDPKERASTEVAGTDKRELLGVDDSDKYVLSFEKLTIFVPSVKKSRCFANGNPVANFSHEYLGVQITEREPFYALDGVSGWLETGQMCLVLGGEQQNKSALLRVLSGRPNNKQDEQGGNVMLNGMPLSKSLQGWRRLCPYVSASDNTHSAVLTVRETFEFAAQCNSDGKQSKEEIDERVN